jgi:hypothetical protein
MMTMATKSFLKNIVIKDGKQAERFLKALENAEKKKSKEITINQRVEEIKNPEQIRKLFAR